MKLHQLPKPLKYFPAWLKKNQHRFRHKPEIIDVDKKSITLKFQGVIPAIQPVVAIDGIRVVVYYQPGEYFDCLCDIECPVVTLEDGRFCCFMCKYDWEANHEKKKMKKYRIFDSDKELVEKHCYEHFLYWSNKSIRDTNYLWLHGVSGHWDEARIIKPNRLHDAIDKHLIQIVSLKEFNLYESK